MVIVVPSDAPSDLLKLDDALIRAADKDTGTEENILDKIDR